MAERPDPQTLDGWHGSRGLKSAYWSHEEEAFDLNAPLGTTGWTIEFTGHAEYGDSPYLSVTSASLRAMADLIDARDADAAAEQGASS